MQEDFINLSIFKTIGKSFTASLDNIVAKFGKFTLKNSDEAAAAAAKAAAKKSDDAAMAAAKVAAKNVDDAAATAAKVGSKKTLKYAKPLAKAGMLAGVAGVGLGLSGVFGDSAQKGLQNAASSLFEGLLDAFGNLIPDEFKQAFSYIIWIIIGLCCIFIVKLIFPPNSGSNLYTILTLLIIFTVIGFIMIDLSITEDESDNKNE